MSTSFVANIFLRGKIECITGLHIGGSKDKFEIGGVDNPVHRDPLSRVPYIPGSSLKGKLRMLLEYHLGVVDSNGKPSDDLTIINLFGIGAGSRSDGGAENEVSDVGEQQEGEEEGNRASEENSNQSGPVRLIIRDSWPDATTQEKWKFLDSELLYMEYKPENTVDRITSDANPRTMERIVKGSYFDFEMILGVYSIDDAMDDYQESLKNLRSAMMQLEHSTLGGSGSRGYGKIKFWLLEPVVVTQADYVAGNESFSAASEAIPNLNEENRHLFSEISEGDLVEKVKENVNAVEA